MSAFYDLPQGLPQGLPQDLPLDLLAPQELSEDLIAMEGSSKPESTVDDDLFGGSGTVDLSSTPALDSSELEASCLTEDGQPLTKLRSRDGPVCTRKDKPPKLINPFKTLKKFFKVTYEEDYELPPSKLLEPSEDPRCILGFPQHLCCQERGEVFKRITMDTLPAPGTTIYDYFFKCDPGT